jgi:putative oxidoreductase
MQVTHLLKPTHSIAALRMMMGVIFILHSGVRIYNNSLPGFGGYLENKGLPFGFYLACTVTIFELAGGIFMFFRRFVKIFCIGEILILITGIFTLHWQGGWFADSMTLGGMESSIVLITILLAVFFAEKKAKGNIKSV